MSQNTIEDRDRAVLSSTTSISAMAIAYLLVFIVLGDPDITDTLMNGVAPPGTDVVGNRVTVVSGMLAAVGAWIAAVASRRVIPIALMLMASVPFAPMLLFTLALAFGG